MPISAVLLLVSGVQQQK